LSLPNVVCPAESRGYLPVESKVGAIIVDLSLGEQAGVILDAARLAQSNQKAVTFPISGERGGRHNLPQETTFVCQRPLSAKSTGKTLRPAYGLILKAKTALFPLPSFNPGCHPEASQPEARCSSVNISEGSMTLSTIVPLSTAEKVHLQFTGDRCLEVREGGKAARSRPQRTESRVRK